MGSVLAKMWRSRERRGKIEKPDRLDPGEPVQQEETKRSVRGTDGAPREPIA